MQAMRTIVTIFGLVAALGAAAIVYGFGSETIAHASKFGSCNQITNGLLHSAGFHGKVPSDTRRSTCSNFKP